MPTSNLRMEDQTLKGSFVLHNMIFNIKSLVQAPKTKSLLKMSALRSIKKWTLKMLKSFLISNLAGNSNEKLARHFRNTFVLSDRKSLQTKETSVRKCL